MKKENKGAYGFDRSKEGYSKKVLAESTQIISEIMKQLRAIPSEKRAEASRLNGRKGGRPRNPPTT